MPSISHLYTCDVYALFRVIWWHHDLSQRRSASATCALPWNGYEKQPAAAVWVGADCKVELRLAGRMTRGPLGLVFAGAEFVDPFCDIIRGLCKPGMQPRDDERPEG
jgi:hypothetical protein